MTSILPSRAQALRRCAGALALMATATATVSAAQTPLSGAEFEAYTEGRTLWFYSGGQAYGAERYKPGRQVEWSFLDGECQDGHWYESGQFICFLYDYDPESPQCWTFFREGNGLRALFEGVDGGTELYEASDADDEMLCLGPQIGV